MGEKYGFNSIFGDHDLDPTYIHSELVYQINNLANEMAIQNNVNAIFIRTLLLVHRKDLEALDWTNTEAIKILDKLKALGYDFT